MFFIVLFVVAVAAWGAWLGPIPCEKMGGYTRDVIPARCFVYWGIR